jgi:type II restriction enzyme
MDRLDEVGSLTHGCIDAILRKKLYMDRNMAQFRSLVEKITSVSVKGSFEDQTKQMCEYVDSLKDADIKVLVKEMGTIPESIKASSSEEKLFSKTSDIVLSRCFNMLGLKSTPLSERANSADVMAESIYHQYDLVSDAKCFRMSRTAKNQKDFKVAALGNWRGDEFEYAVLVSPYFQYPKKESQIYKAALDNEVCLLAWEHISILLDCNIKESKNFSLETIWKSSQMMKRNTTVDRSSKCFLPKINEFVAKKLNKNIQSFNKLLGKYKTVIRHRGEFEIECCQKRLEAIDLLTREQAIKQLKKETKLEERIKVIKGYILSLDGEENG